MIILYFELVATGCQLVGVDPSAVEGDLRRSNMESRVCRVSVARPSSSILLVVSSDVLASLVEMRRKHCVMLNRNIYISGSTLAGESLRLGLACAWSEC